MRMFGLRWIAFAIAMWGCVVETGDPMPTSTNLLQEVNGVAIVGCRVGGDAQQSGLCFTEVQSFIVKRVVATVVQSAIPVEYRLYKWTVTSRDAAHAVVSGCQDVFGFLNECVFEVMPECTGTHPLDKAFQIKVQVRDSRNIATLEEGIASALVPNVNGCLSTSNCEVPPAMPSFSMDSWRCGGMHSIFFPPVPGSGHTQIQTKPWLDVGLGIGPQTSWDTISTGYDFPGITADLQYGPCIGDASGSFYARARACNECGCSPWTAAQIFNYFTGECS